MKTLSRLFLLGAGIFLFACSKNYDPGNAGTANIHVHLTDGPALFDKVLIDIQDVQIKTISDTSDSGWKSINLVKKGVYNLLDFKNGADTILGSQSVPAGPVGQMRLVLGTNNSVVVGGVNFPLQTPSAQQSGLKLLINTSLSAGIDYHFFMDFDAARSIVQTGNGNFILKPVIRIFTEANSGAIKGTVLPVKAKAWVFAIANATDTISSTPADTTTGAFLLKGIPASSSYKVSFHSMAGGYADTTITAVSVTNGVVTNVGTIQLH